MTILAIIGGFLGLHIKGALDYYRLRSDVGSLATEIRRLQVEALSRHAEMTLELFVDKTTGKISYKSSTDEVVDEINKKRPVAFLGANSLQFLGYKDDKDPKLEPIFQLTRSDSSDKKLTFRVSHAGRVEPLGFLQFSANSQVAQEEAISIDLHRPLFISIQHIQFGQS